MDGRMFLREDEEKTEEVIDEKISFTEKEETIIDLLNEYIKPAVESDGGAIDFKSFQKGTVTVTLRGACSGCPRRFRRTRRRATSESVPTWRCQPSS